LAEVHGVLIPRNLILTSDTDRHTLASALDRRQDLTQESTNLLQGTLDLMILKALALEEMHGLGISRRIEQITKGTFRVGPGSLFPALHKMEEAGWLTSSWGESENNRKAKYYRLTKAGRRQLETETQRWGRISLAIARALEAS
jgi:PadR family transcriptional regulator, regulatory protein PadR